MVVGNQCQEICIPTSLLEVMYNRMTDNVSLLIMKTFIVNANSVANILQFVMGQMSQHDHTEVSHIWERLTSHINPCHPRFSTSQHQHLTNDLL